MADKPTLVISTFSGLVAAVRSVFTRRNWPYVIPLMIAAVMVNGRKTITNLIRLCRLRRYFSGFHRFFSEYRWCEVQLAREVLGLIQACFPGLPELHLALDDTLCDKPRGKTFGACLFNKKVNGHNRYREGHNWVVLGVVLQPPESQRRIFFPLLANLYVRREELDDPAEFRTKFQIAGALVSALTEGLQTRVIVVADGAYAAGPFLTALKMAAVAYVGRLRKDARLYDPVPRKNHRGRRGKHGRRLPALKYLFGGKAVRTVQVRAYGKVQKVRVREFVAYWPSVDGVLKVIAVKGLGREPALLFSTDTTMPTQQIIETFAARWKIELGFRDGKQFMGLGETQARKKRAILRQTNFLIAVQSLVQLWYLKKYGDVLLDDPDPWYRHKCAPSFEDMRRALRRELWGETIRHVCAPLAKVRKAARVVIKRLKAVI